MKRSKRARRRLGGLIFLITLTLIFGVIVYFYSLIDQLMMPSVIEIATLTAKNQINQMVNESIRRISDDLGIVSTDFFIKTTDPNGKIDTLSVNTILVNDICSRLSSDLSVTFLQLNPDTISIPIGTALGIKALANIGPKYPIKVMPVGEVSIDYESSFTSEGINQINLQIWITIQATVQIVNPLQNREIVVTRNMPLINTVISGEVPPTYINTEQKK